LLSLSLFSPILAFIFSKNYVLFAIFGKSRKTNFNNLKNFHFKKGRLPFLGLPSLKIYLFSVFVFNN